MRPASVDVATVCRFANAGLLPARSCRSEPEEPRESRTEEIVTVRPMSSSRPVPAYRFPKDAEVYQSVRQGVAGLPLTASAAFCGSSPPLGPKAATLAGARACATTGLAEGVSVGLACAVPAWTLGVTDGAPAVWPPWDGCWLVTAAALWVLPTPEANLYPAKPST